MIVKNPSKDKSCIMYNNEHLKPWKTLNTLALKFPQIVDSINVLLVTQRWEKAYYALENICNGEKVQWVLKNDLQQGNNIPKSSWKEFKNIQRHSLVKFLLPDAKITSH